MVAYKIDRFEASFYVKNPHEWISWADITVALLLGIGSVELRETKRRHLPNTACKNAVYF